MSDLEEGGVKGSCVKRMLGGQGPDFTFVSAGRSLYESNLVELIGDWFVSLFSTIERWF